MPEVALPLRLCVRRTSAAAEPGTRVFLKVPSDVACIEEAVEVLVRHCLTGTRPSPRTRFRLQVALSEALANAVLNGNRGDGAKLVHVQAELLPELIRIHVTDEGNGFDPAAVPLPLSAGALDAPGGRGLFLIRRLVDALQFNERGNSICMTLRRQ